LNVDLKRNFLKLYNLIFMDNFLMEKVVLASDSATRQEMLRRVGLEIIVAASNLNESVIKVTAKTDKAAPRNLAAQLAEAKAAAVAMQYRDEWIIGADQILACREVFFDKPHSREEARKTLRYLSGRSHELHTAACVMRDGVVQWCYVDTAKLWMRTLSQDFIEGYLDQVGDEVLCSVGCYQIERLGAQLFNRVQGDLFSIQGLPLLPLLVFLRSHGLMPK